MANDLVIRPQNLSVMFLVFNVTFIRQITVNVLFLFSIPLSKEKFKVFVLVN